MKSTRIDVIFDVKDATISTLDQIIDAIKSGETVIKTSISYKDAHKVDSTYDEQGNCLTVGVYSNEFAEAFRALGIDDIRYGSTNGWNYGLAEGNYSDSYKLYTPKGWIAPNKPAPTTLAERINEYGDSQEEYITENPDSSYAEFCQSFGYGEVDDSEIYRALDDIDELDEYMDKIKLLGKKTLLDLLEKHCTLESTGIRCLYDEVYSVIIGEYETQLPDELAEEIAELDEDELESLKKDLNYYLSGDCLYIDCNYDRWVMILDPEEFIKELETIKIHIVG